jgi:ElaB/YqjD/DUF883 family membrane-anchored ribosome-binding protein
MNRLLTKNRKGSYKMDNQQFENKVRKDADKVKKDVSTLIGDSATQFGRFEENVNQAANKTKADINSWIENNARDTVEGTANSVMKNVDRQFSQFNAKAEEVANTVPGRFGEKVAKYPYVAISIAVILGFLAGSLLSPAKQPMHR